MTVKLKAGQKTRPIPTSIASGGNMNNVPYIRDIREKRAVEALLKYESIPVKDIGSMVGALNARQNISKLRNQGFQDIILTERFEVVDRDGKICRPGKYLIPAALKPIAEEAVKKYVTQASANAKVTTGKNLNKPNHNKGGA